MKVPAIGVALVSMAATITNTKSTLGIGAESSTSMASVSTNSTGPE